MRILLCASLCFWAPLSWAQSAFYYLPTQSTPMSEDTAALAEYLTYKASQPGGLAAYAVAKYYGSNQPQWDLMNAPLGASSPHADAYLLAKSDKMASDLLLLEHYMRDPNANLPDIKSKAADLVLALEPLVRAGAELSSASPNTKAAWAIGTTVAGLGAQAAKGNFSALEDVGVNLMDALLGTANASDDLKAQAQAIKAAHYYRALLDRIPHDVNRFSQRLALVQAEHSNDPKVIAYRKAAIAALQRHLPCPVGAKADCFAEKDGAFANTKSYKLLKELQAIKDPKARAEMAQKRAQELLEEQSKELEQKTEELKKTLAEVNEKLKNANAKDKEELLKRKGAIQDELQRRSAQQAKADYFAAGQLLSRVVGIADPVAGRQLHAVITAQREAIAAVESFKEAFASNKFSSTAIFSADLIGIGLNLAGAFFGGPPPEKAILDAIRGLSEQITRLDENLNRRFDHVDIRLNEISKQIREGFESLHREISSVQRNLKYIESSLQHQLNALRIYAKDQKELIRLAADRQARQDLLECSRFRELFPDRYLSIADLRRCQLNLSRYLEQSTDGTATNNTQPLSVSKARSLLEEPLHRNLGFISRLLLQGASVFSAQAGAQSHLSAFHFGPLADSENWLYGAQQFEATHRDWSDYAKHFSPVALQQYIGMGQRYRDFQRLITQQPGHPTGSVLFDLLSALESSYSNVERGAANLLAVREKGIGGKNALSSLTDGNTGFSPPARIRMGLCHPQNPNIHEYRSWANNDSNKNGREPISPHFEIEHANLTSTAVKYLPDAAQRAIAVNAVQLSGCITEIDFEEQDPKHNVSEWKHVLMREADQDKYGNETVKHPDQYPDRFDGVWQHHITTRIVMRVRFKLQAVSGSQRWDLVTLQMRSMPTRGIRYMHPHIIEKPSRDNGNKRTVKVLRTDSVRHSPTFMEIFGRETRVGGLTGRMRNIFYQVPAEVMGGISPDVERLLLSQGQDAIRNARNEALQEISAYWQAAQDPATDLTPETLGGEMRRLAALKQLFRTAATLGLSQSLEESDLGRAYVHGSLSIQDPGTLITAIRDVDTRNDFVSSYLAPGGFGNNSAAERGGIARVRAWLSEEIKKNPQGQVDTALNSKLYDLSRLKETVDADQRARTHVQDAIAEIKARVKALP